MSVAIDGTWYLMGEMEDEIDIPLHHVAFVFRNDPGHLYGTMINRLDGAETPLDRVQFDGTNLELQLPNQTQGYLGMTQSGEKFEGFWMKSASEKMGVKLKLVKAN